MDNEGPLQEGVASHYVECRPKADDPTVTERRHRAACLLKLTPNCPTCPNNKFTLFFDVPEKRFEQVQCPRWSALASLHQGKTPDSYEVTEEATCKDRPFPFCGSCPSRQELEKLSIDKKKDGWFSRWIRFRKEADDY